MLKFLPFQILVMVVLFWTILEIFPIHTVPPGTPLCPQISNYSSQVYGSLELTDMYHEGLSAPSSI